MAIPGLVFKGLHSDGLRLCSPEDASRCGSIGPPIPSWAFEPCHSCFGPNGNALGQSVKDRLLRASLRVFA